MFYGNPLEITLGDIDEIIEFFENTEEYEKCKELTDYKNLLDLDMLLERLRVKNGTTNYFDGNIASIQIYHQALSSNEVLHNYNALKNRFS